MVLSSLWPVIKDAKNKWSKLRKFFGYASSNAVKPKAIRRGLHMPSSKVALVLDEPILPVLNAPSLSAHMPSITMYERPAAAAVQASMIALQLQVYCTHSCSAIREFALFPMRFDSLDS